MNNKYNGCESNNNIHTLFYLHENIKKIHFLSSNTNTAYKSLENS